MLSVLFLSTFPIANFLLFFFFCLASFSRGLSPLDWSQGEISDCHFLTPVSLFCVERCFVCCVFFCFFFFDLENNSQQKSIFNCHRSSHDSFVLFVFFSVYFLSLYLSFYVIFLSFVLFESSSSSVVCSTIFLFLSTSSFTFAILFFSQFLPVSFHSINFLFNLYSCFIYFHFIFYELSI